MASNNRFGIYAGGGVCEAPDLNPKHDRLAAFRFPSRSEPVASFSLYVSWLFGFGVTCLSSSSSSLRLATNAKRGAHFGFNAGPQVVILA